MTDAIQAYTGGELTVTGPTATAAIFSTYPADYLGIWGGVIDQVGCWAFTDLQTRITGLKMIFYQTADFVVQPRNILSVTVSVNANI